MDTVERHYVVRAAAEEHPPDIATIQSTVAAVLTPRRRVPDPDTLHTWWDLLRGHAQLLVGLLEERPEDATAPITRFGTSCARARLAAGLPDAPDAAYVYLQELARTVRALLGIALDDPDTGR